MMMAFVIETLGIHMFRAKIGESNQPSRSLFRKLVSFSLSIYLPPIYLSHSHLQSISCTYSHLNMFMTMLPINWIEED